MSLASCTAITMEMYAARKGWNIGDVEVACEYAPAERGCPFENHDVLESVPAQLDRRGDPADPGAHDDH